MKTGARYFGVKRFRRILGHAVFAIASMQGYILIRGWFFTRSKIEELFSSIEEGSSIVEVGASTASTLKFYPKNCSVTLVDSKYSKKRTLKHVKYARENLGTHLKEVTTVAEKGERLSDHISPGSVDYVTCCNTLCSVKDVPAVLHAVKTVLKPGGKFLFAEHCLADEDNAFRRKLMLFKNYTELFCQHREPWNDVNDADFSHLDFHKHEFTCLYSRRFWVTGTAVK